MPMDEREIGLRFRGVVELHRVAGTHHGAAREPLDEKLRKRHDGAAVERAFGRHRDQLAVEKLDRLALVNDADFEHAMILGHGDRPYANVALFHLTHRSLRASAWPVRVAWVSAS